MEMNHTPGPWTLDEDGTILSDFGTVATVHGWDNQDSETRPNGRLLAASPLLLEAAEAVRDAWESGDLAGAVRQLSAAIAAARGEG